MKQNKFTKIIVIFILIVSLFSFVSCRVANNAVSTDTNSSAGSFLVKKNETYNKDIILKTFQSFKNDGVIDGFVTIYSNEFSGIGSFNNTVIALSNNLNSNANFKKNLIAFGSSYYLADAKIAKDAFLFVSDYISSEKTILGGDMMLYTNSAEVKGKIGGDVIVIGDKVLLDADIKGNVRVGANEIILGNNLKVNGSVSYESTRPIIKQDSAKISGKLEEKNLGYNITNQSSNQNMLYSIIKLFGTSSLIIAFILGLIYIRLFNLSSMKVSVFIKSNMIRCISVGSSTLILSIILGILLFLSVYGMPLAMIIFNILYLLYFISPILTSLLLGGFIIRNYNNQISRYMLGFSIFIIPTLINFGMITMFFAVLFRVIGIGALMIMVFEKIKKHRNKEKINSNALKFVISNKDNIMDDLDKFSKNQEEDKDDQK